ncbi:MULTISPECIES: sensor histidine kinase [Gordonibacter]|uniref:Sensor-like histidine kinase SenX3 n=1 Tax=Gordonibacter faecis TaxID=3047475 RepID=A0ABT7DLU8_9ACTN|nr:MULTISPECIES: HAMP domain-containing sensor histidine kinase [unclassified Gordonibacter]MDJ1649546.1 HAMP domain-containing sensor histidine kinase [Gordonibacter sp. KGMB12511]
MMRANQKQRRGAAPNLARFFTKQLLLFMALAFLIVVVDFFLYALIAYRESNEHYNDGTPVTTVRAVDAALSRDEGGAWIFAPKGLETLAEQDAWALLVDGDGNVAWSHGVPTEVPRVFTPNDIAMAAHYADLAGYPTFFWNRDDGLLVVGFPKGEYWHESLTFPTSTITNLPLYVLLIFSVDLAILFVMYVVSRRRTQNAVGPIAEALDALSEGRAAELHLKGDLRDIGQQITETSGIIEQKDAARANWIRGISHDIRTPLSMILGYADAIASSEATSDEARASAQVIRAQGLKIKDLVTDLNTASKLDYDLQPLHLERVHLPRLLRTVVAGHVNSGLDELHPLELDVAEDAAEAVVLGDERLLTRAVENAIANARVHNETGCTVAVSLHVADGHALVRVADDGAGATPEELAALEARLARARTARSAAGSYGEEHGLGLVLVDRIARVHDGALKLESKPNYGFTVELSLPLV